MTKKAESESKAFEDLMNDQQEGVFNLAPGISAEEMIAEFFNEDALVEAPEKIYRLSGSKDRYYYSFDPEGEPIFYVSVTTMIKFTMPTSPHLIKWIADMGYDEAQNYAADKADYGTFMHKEINHLIISRRYNLDDLRPRLKEWIEKEKLPQDFINYEDQFKKDLLAMAQFLKDYQVKPLAVEIVLPHKEDGYAGAIDLVCEMVVQVDGLDHENPYKTGPRKGQPRECKVDKTVVAIVDHKSGRKGFYPENEIQLQAYKQMWEQHFPNRPIEKLFNWSPKDWRGSTPTYNLKDQTDSKNRKKLEHLVQLAKIESDGKETNHTIVSGVIDLDKGVEENVMEMSLSDLVKKRKAERDQEKR